MTYTHKNNTNTDTQASHGLLQKAALWPMALWLCGLMALLLFLITQRHYSHPGSTGSMQAAKVRKFAYRLHFISASYAQHL